MTRTIYVGLGSSKSYVDWPSWDQARRFLVYRPSDQLYWKPGRCWYTPDVLYAGLYTKEEADRCARMRTPSEEIVIDVADLRIEILHIASRAARLQRLVNAQPR